MNVATVCQARENTLHLLATSEMAVITAHFSRNCRVTRSQLTPDWGAASTTRPLITAPLGGARNQGAGSRRQHLASPAPAARGEV